MLSNKIVVF